MPRQRRSRPPTPRRPNARAGRLPPASQRNVQWPAVRAVNCPDSPLAPVNAMPYCASSGTPQKSMRGSHAASSECAMANASSRQLCRASWNRTGRRGPSGKQRREIAPGGFRHGGPIGKREIARLDPMPGVELARRERAPVGRGQAQRAGGFGAVEALAQHRPAAAVAAYGQIGVRFPLRQQLVAKDAIVDDGQQVEGKTFRQHVPRRSGNEMRAKPRQQIRRLRQGGGKTRWTSQTPRGGWRLAGETNASRLLDAQVRPATPPFFRRSQVLSVTA